MDAPADSLSIGLAEQMLDHLPHTSFSVKDQSLRYIGLNSSMIDLCGARSRADVLGRSARDFFSDADRFEDLDRFVLRTGRPVRDKLALLRRIRGSPTWIFFGKWPIFASPNVVAGVIFVARTLDAPNRRHSVYERLSKALDYMHSNVSADVDLPKLAALAGLTVMQLERDFVRLIGMPPRRYLTSLRMEAAVEMLEASNDPILKIAEACGYSDQSAFTRRFRAAVGVSPSEYRACSRRASAPPYADYIVKGPEAAETATFLRRHSG